MKTIRNIIALALFGTVVSASRAQAQFPTDTLNASGVLALLRTTGNAAAAARFLRQEGRRRSLQDLDEVADSLVAVVVSYQGDDGPKAAHAAQESLAALAGSALPGAIAELAGKRAQKGLPPPVPYPHAFAKLVEVIQRAPDVGIRGATLWTITQLGDTSRAVAVLADVADDDDVIAPTAIRHLSADTGEAGIAALRRLYVTHAVVYPQAQEVLEAIASVRGWKR